MAKGLVFAIILIAGTLTTPFTGFTAEPDSTLIKRTSRPPNYETPVDRLQTPGSNVTQNKDLFVRNHLANIPKIILKDWTLKIEGDAIEAPLTFTYDTLKKNFKPVEVTALLYCSGNGRGLFQPPVAGVQWKYGGMGNVHWRGIRLKDLLAKAGLKKNAVEIEFNGADGPVFPKTPDFVKSLPVEKALDDNTLIAFAMNGKPLPQNHGFPARLIVPGWTATYWVKQLTSIRVLSKPSESYWVAKVYRVTKGKFSAETPWKSQETETSTPITEIAVNSVIINPTENRHIKRNSKVTIHGLAWDAGHGLAKVQVSVDNGKTWNSVYLNQGKERFSWHSFTYSFVPKTSGEWILSSRATDKIGHTQPDQAVPSGAGYHYNAIQKTKIVVDGSSAPSNSPDGRSDGKSPGEPILVEAPGRDRVTANCTMCHSLDYVEMNHFLGRDEWQKIVNKMIQNYGAPIQAADVPVIVDYLTKWYGKKPAQE